MLEDSKSTALLFAIANALPYMMYAVGFTFGGYLASINQMNTIDVLRHDTIPQPPNPYPHHFRTFFAVSFCGVALSDFSSQTQDIIKGRMAASQMFALCD